MNYLIVGMLVTATLGCMAVVRRFKREDETRENLAMKRYLAHEAQKRGEA